MSSVIIKKFILKFFTDNGITSDADVNVTIVGQERMKTLAKKFLNENNTIHNVLSFPGNETSTPFQYPQDDILHLGDIVVCYTKAFEEAKLDGMRIEDKIIELISHGGYHLLGIHHV